MQISLWRQNLIANWVLLFQMLLFPVTEQSILITRNVRLHLYVPILIRPGHHSFRLRRFLIIPLRIPYKPAPQPEYSQIFLATTPRLQTIVLTIWVSLPGHLLNFLITQTK